MRKKDYSMESRLVAYTTRFAVPNAYKSTSDASEMPPSRDDRAAAWRGRYWWDSMMTPVRSDTTRRFLTLIGWLLVLFVATSAAAQNPMPPGFNGQGAQWTSGSICPPVAAPAGQPGSLYTCTGDGSIYGWTGSAWVEAAGAGGASPAGSGSELQYRVDGSTFGGITGSSWDGSVLSGIPAIAVGTAPYAGSGAIRLPSDGEIKARDTGDSADVSIVRIENDVIVIANNSDAYPIAIGDVTVTPNEALPYIDPVVVLGAASFTGNSTAGAVLFADVGHGQAIVNEGAVVGVGFAQLLVGNNIYAFGDQNAIGASPTDYVQTAFAFGDTNVINATGAGATDVLVFGRQNETTNKHVMLFGRGLSETDANQTWFGDASHPVFFQSGDSDTFRFVGTPILSSPDGPEAGGAGVDVGVRATDAVDDGMMTPANGGNVNVTVGLGVNAGADGLFNVTGSGVFSGSVTATDFIVSGLTTPTNKPVCFDANGKLYAGTNSAGTLSCP
jgi:hypothetical protein